MRALIRSFEVERPARSPSPSSWDVVNVSFLLGGGGGGGGCVRALVFSRSPYDPDEGFIL